LFNHNPNLNPDHITNYETGISQTFLNDRFNLELTGFIVKGKNLIINVPLQGLMNAGEIDNKGIEFAANGRFTDNLSVNMTYSFIGMKSPVYATPKNHFYMSGRYELNKWGLMAGIEYVNHLDTDPTPISSFQNYTLVNARVFYRPIKKLEIYLSGENLLGEKYKTIRYYPMPGTTVFGGLNFTL